MSSHTSSFRSLFLQNSSKKKNKKSTNVNKNDHGIIIVSDSDEEVPIIEIDDNDDDDDDNDETCEDSDSSDLGMDIDLKFDFGLDLDALLSTSTKKNQKSFGNSSLIDDIGNISSPITPPYKKRRILTSTTTSNTNTNLDLNLKPKTENNIFRKLSFNNRNSSNDNDDLNLLDIFKSSQESPSSTSPFLKRHSDDKYSKILKESSKISKLLMEEKLNEQINNNKKELIRKEISLKLRFNNNDNNKEVIENYIEYLYTSEFESCLMKGRGLKFYLFTECLKEVYNDGSENSKLKSKKSKSNIKYEEIFTIDDDPNKIILKNPNLYFSTIDLLYLEIESILLSSKTINILFFNNLLYVNNHLKQWFFKILKLRISILNFQNWNFIKKFWLNLGINEYLLDKLKPNSIVANDNENENVKKNKGKDDLKLLINKMTTFDNAASIPNSDDLLNVIKIYLDLMVFKSKSKLEIQSKNNSDVENEIDYESENDMTSEQVFKFLLQLLILINADNHIRTQTLSCDISNLISKFYEWCFIVFNSSFLKLKNVDIQTYLISLTCSTLKSIKFPSSIIYPFITNIPKSESDFMFRLQIWLSLLSITNYNDETENENDSHHPENENENGNNQLISNPDYSIGLPELGFVIMVKIESKMDFLIKNGILEDYTNNINLFNSEHINNNSNNNNNIQFQILNDLKYRMKCLFFLLYGLNGNVIPKKFIKIYKNDYINKILNKCFKGDKLKIGYFNEKENDDHSEIKTEQNEKQIFLKSSLNLNSNNIPKIQKFIEFDVSSPDIVSIKTLLGYYDLIIQTCSKIS